jgi:hypothetical protein
MASKSAATMRGCAFANCAAAESARVNYLIAMITRPYGSRSWSTSTVTVWEKSRGPPEMVCDTFLTTPVISLDSGNPSTPPIRMRSPLRMVANGVSDTIATLSVWLSLPLQANLTKNNLNLKVIKYNLLLSYSWNAATTRA